MMIISVIKDAYLLNSILTNKSMLFMSKFCLLLGYFENMK